jgi:hypothetical protein
MNLFLIVSLVTGLVFIAVSWAKADLHCPPPKIVYRTVPKHTLDVQFGDPDNNPSVVYEDMFTKSSPWIGGFDLGSGKTLVAT